MGSALSLNGSKTRLSDHFEVSMDATCKRQRLSSSPCEESETLRLIPILPDEISLQILARVPRIFYLNMRLVSRNWKGAIMSTELFHLRKELGMTEEWLYVLTKIKDKMLWYSLDPLSRKWLRLPPMHNFAHEDGYRRGLSGLRMLNMVGSTIKIADVIRGWLGRRDALDQIPFCGSSFATVNGRLYMLGGFSRASALASVWYYDPVQNRWSEMSPMSIGRAYCKTGVLNNKLYVVGGVTRGHGGLIPLQSAEVFDPCTGLWSQIPSMPFAKAQVLPTAFLADLLKPIATGMTAYKGKLFVPQSLYYWPFFVDVGGEVYDPETNSWFEMPAGMGEGWPARQAGAKLSAIVDNELYALDPSSSSDIASVKVYDSHCDSWTVVSTDVPIHDLTESESPYLLASFLGKLHVITKDANNNFTVLQANMQNHLHSFASTPLSHSGNNSSEHAESAAESEPDVWKVIAARSAGACELVSCQILGI